jgi:hypothetical protein
MTSLNALFGSKLRLLGYQLQREEDQGLSPAWTVTLLWRSERLMSTDYKISVEVFDPESGRRVARDDAMPLRWAFRTSYWDMGEVVTDAIPLSLQSVPADLYSVAVTVYDPETGKRLPVIDGNGQLQPRGQMVLAGHAGANPERVEIEVGVTEQPPDLTPLDVPHPLQREVIPQLRLLGYDLKRQAMLVGGRVAVKLFWEARGQMNQDHDIRLALVGRNGETYGQKDFDIVDIDYPTTEWRQGDVLADWYVLRAADDMPSGDVALTLNLLNQPGDPVLTEPVEIVTLWVQAIEPSFEMPHDVDQRDPVNLDDKVALLAYEVEPVVKPGERVGVTLYWQAQREMDTSYKVFVHLYDGEGQIVAQRDRLPGLGARPTSVWETDEIVADRYYVPTSADVAAGRYELAVGLYDPQTGERLAAFDSDGEPLKQDRIPLGHVELRP